MNFQTQLSSVMATGVFPALANVGVLEKMDVSRTAVSSDGSGGQTPGSTTTPYTNISVEVAKDGTGKRVDMEGKPIALQTYILTFPMTTSAGATIDIGLATDKFVINAYGPFAARTYRIICPVDDTGPVNQFVCVKED